MPKFNYVARDNRAQEKKGTIEAENQSEALARLKQMDLFPESVTQEGAGKAAKGKKGAKGKSAKGGKKKAGEINLPGIPMHKVPGFRGVKAKILTTFTRQLATLVDAGLPLLRGLRVLQKQEKNGNLKRIIGELAVAIEGGSTFSEGLAQHPKVFNRLYVNMVKAGELGGVLEVVLNRLSEFMEKAQKIKGKVVAAMFYPAAVMLVATAILVILMVFVVPKFKQIFIDMLEGAALPAFTEIVLKISDTMKDNFLQVALVVAALFFVLKIATLFKWGRLAWDWVKLHIPVLGSVINKVAIARFTRTLGTLVSSGVPILQALTIVRETAGNQVIANAVSGVHEAVKEGESITKPLEASKVFPPMVISMVDVGEQTGALPEMLMRIADNYDEEVDNAVAAMTSLLEPIMIVFLAVIVGSIVIALFLPLIVLIDKLGQ